MKKMIKTSKNPIIPRQGVCDPHIHVYNDCFYLYASHDESEGNIDYVMKNWCIWSSHDLVTWNLESIVKPEDFYMGYSKECWATDAAEKNGKYYFYFSNINKQIGVATSNNPGKNFVDALNKPILDRNITLVPSYDPAIYTDETGAYIAFGGPEWAYGKGAGYFIARLNDDMISLAEEPRRIILNHEGDDKISINKIGDLFYLTFASYYATSDNIYGPYKYRGNFGASSDHGSIFEHKGQLFNAFTINDPTIFYRSTGICYLHQNNKGELFTDQMIIEYGVGQYDSNWNKIEAEWFMHSKNMFKKQNERFGFDMSCDENGGAIYFPNVHNMKDDTNISFFAACTYEGGATIKIMQDSLEGNIIGKCFINNTKGLRGKNFIATVCNLKIKKGTNNIWISVKPTMENAEGEFRLDYFRFYY